MPDLTMSSPEALTHNTYAFERISISLSTKTWTVPEICFHHTLFLLLFLSHFVKEDTKRFDVTEKDARGRVRWRQAMQCGNL